MPENVSLWCGRPLTELSREELIEAVEELGAAYQAALKEHSRQLGFLDSLERSRK